MRNTAAMIFLFFVMPFVFLAGCTVNGSSSQEDVENDIESIVFRNLDSGTSFVGDIACFDCHENQYRGFKEHGMANSMYLLTRDTAVEDFGSEVVVDSTTGLRYETVAADSGFFMVETILDEEGKEFMNSSDPWSMSSAPVLLLGPMSWKKTVGFMSCQLHGIRKRADGILARGIE